MLTDPILQKILFILFTLTIFFLLAVQLVQLTKQYLLPILRKNIALLNQFWEDLNNKINLLSKTKKRVEKSIEEQKETLENLEEKMKIWHENRTSKQKSEEKSHAELLHNLQQKKQHQYKHLQMIKSEKALLPEALKNAKKELVKIFSGNDGKKRLQDVISEIDKS